MSVVGRRALRPARLATLLVFLALGITACSSDPLPGEPDAPDSAAVSGISDGRYTNEFFGLMLPIPEGWSVASDESEAYIMDAGSTVMEGDAALEAAAEAARKTTFQLLTLSQFEMGAAVESNPMLLLMAERVSHVPGIKNGKDYLFHLTKVLTRTELPYEVIDEARSVTLGDREWYRIQFQVSAAGQDLQQDYYAMKQDDYVLSVLLTATHDAMPVLEEIAGRITLKSGP